MVSRLTEAAMDDLNEVWVNPIDLSLPKLATKGKKPQVNKEELFAGLNRAADPTDKDGQPLPDPNPHWPSANHPWSHEFAMRATEQLSARSRTLESPS